MFGVDDMLIGAAITGGVSLYNSAQQNQANQNLSWQQNMFNAQQAGVSRDFNAAEAQKGRAFSAEQLANAQHYNAAEAEKARQFAWGSQEGAKDFNRAEAATNRDFTSAEAQKARDYTSMMSNTAFQRAKSDMTAAGLNPILAYRQGAANVPGATGAAGSSASVGSVSGPAASANAPGASSASSSPAHAGQIFPTVGWQGALASAMEAYKLKPQVDQLQAQTQVTKADKEVRDQDVIKRNQEAKNEAARYDQIKQETELLKERTDNERRAQSHLRFGGASVNPEAIGEKLSGVAGSAWDFVKRKAGELGTDAKSLYKMYNGD